MSLEKITTGDSCISGELIHYSHIWDVRVHMGLAHTHYMHVYERLLEKKKSHLELLPVQLQHY